jgi:thiamine-phosphate pyrophosphorylase
MKLPKLYPIADRATLDARGMSVGEFAREMAQAGVGVLQYRDKVGAPNEVLQAAAEIAAEFEGVEATLILNDRADLAVLAGWGVHVGQGDLSVEDARRVVAAHSCAKDAHEWGSTRISGVVGVSTHTDEQVIAADAGEADYVAVGPVFRTSTKADAEPVVGLDGVRRARALTRKPLVAIGGITRENARSVIDAGADSVAVIGELVVAGERPGKIAKDFLDMLQ